ncbi:MAG: hypothetical protein ACTHOB_18370 [Ginsengibacter sp.]
MKYIPVIIICVAGITACHKSNVSLRETSGSRLTSIVLDSAGTFDFEYTDSLITGFTEHFPAGGVDSGLIQYTQPDSDQLVTITLPGSHYSLNYQLNSSKLPLLVFLSNPDSAIHPPMVQFAYLPGTDRLDSVVAHAMNKDVFKFTYTGQNITGITEWVILNGQNTQVAAFDFTYDSTANIFRQTDPLLYIYSYPPHTAFVAQPMVIAAFFAETFSASTFNGVTTSGITTGGWGQNAISSKMTYQFNSNGKITSETFSNDIFEGLAGKRYVYQ